MDKRCSIQTTVDEDFLENFNLLVEENTSQGKLKFFCPQIDSNAFQIACI